MFGRRRSRRSRSLERKPRRKSVQVRFADTENIPAKIEISRPMQVRRLKSYSGDGSDFMQIHPIRDGAEDNASEGVFSTESCNTKNDKLVKEPKDSKVQRNNERRSSKNTVSLIFPDH